MQHISSFQPQHRASVRQQRCHLWQQHTLACCHLTPVSASTSWHQRSSTRLSAALESLDIQPLTLPSEARQLPDTAATNAAAELDIPPVDTWGQDPFLMSSCEPESAPLRVAVLVSGGVDSSLALKLVTAAGHQATAFYLQIWFQEDFRNFWDACPWEEDLSYAQKVCDALGVPLVVVPLTQQYWDRVVSHSVAEIKEGKTPNPDMLCNSRVKFGAFVEYLQKEHAGSFDRIASGHYAKVQRLQPHLATTSAGAAEQQEHSSASDNHADAGMCSSTSSHDRPADSALLERKASHAHASSSSGSSSSVSAPCAARLLMVPDVVKDQTYFLASLSAAQLARCMFPLGSFTKPQVRALASAAGLATSGRKDSQGICFLGKVKFSEFVAQHLGEWPGPLVEEDTGQVVGVHDGYWLYTVGQRGGIKLPGGPWYVTRKDMAANIVYVSRTYYEQERRRDAFVCGPFNWLGATRPQPQKPLLVKVRHGPHTYECSLQLGTRQEAVAVLEQGTAATYQPQANTNAAAAPVGSDSGHSSSNSRVTTGQQPELQQHMREAVAAAGEGSSHAREVGAVAGGEYGVVLLCGNDQGLAAGQYAVFYQDQECLGSAQIMGSLAGAPSS